MEEAIAKQPPYVRARYTSVETKREFLEGMIRQEILANEALRRGLDKAPEVITATKTMLVTLLMREEFDSKLAPEAVTDDEIAAYYQAHIADYTTAEEVRASALVMTTLAQAKTAVAQARSPEKASNAAFIELVKANTIEAEQKKVGGDLRFFKRDDKTLPAAVVAAAFALQNIGDVSDPIDAGDDRFYVLKLTGRNLPTVKPLDQVKTVIRNAQFQQTREAQRQEFMKSLRANAKIEIFDAGLGDVKVDTKSIGTPAPKSPHDGHDHP